MQTNFLKYILVTALLFVFTVVSYAQPAFLQEELTAVNSQAQIAEQTMTKVRQSKGATGAATYIVQLWDAPLANYTGEIAGLKATNPASRGLSKLDAKAPESVAYLDYLTQQQEQAVAEANKMLGRDLEILHFYQTSLNGFAATMTPEEATSVAQLDSVRAIERERMFELQTDAGPGWIGAPGIWDGSQTGGVPGTYGEGIIVGVIDSGVDPFNPSFAATGGDDYTHTNPYGSGNYVGVCDPTNTNPPAGVVAYDPTFPCNDKLIGVWGYTTSDASPRDTDGHGSHTASTAAGNFVFGAEVNTPTGSYTADISGVAPHANIIVYDGCTDDNGCPGASLAAAMDQLILDGVDVVNFSIGADSPTGDPWGIMEAQQWLAIRNAGIFVAASAGNAGPGAETIGYPGDIPWLTSVGASSHNRTFLNAIQLFDGTDFFSQYLPVVRNGLPSNDLAAAPRAVATSSTAVNNEPITLYGPGMTGAYGPAKVVLASDFVVAPATAEDARLCAPDAFPAGTFDGEIVICERGEYGRVEKGQSVLDGGAGGYILAQAEEIGGGPGGVVTDPHVLPAVHITYADYLTLLDFLATAENDVYGSIAGAVLDVDDANGDIMGAFSSRGANQSVPDVVVPSVTAPGRAIWAAYAQGPDGDNDPTFNVIQGTSMSGPHVAGAGALMKALHPDWTPAEIQSALMTTAVTSVIDDDGVSAATPFGMGSGRINLANAAQAGLVLDVTTAEFEAADPDTGGQPRDLNLASLGDASCLGSCSWTRVVKSTEVAGLREASTISWTASVVAEDGLVLTVNPTTFTLAPGATQALEITADVSAIANVNSWIFGDLILTPATEGVPTAHLPVAVRPTNGNIPDQVDILALNNSDSQTLDNLESIEITDLTIDEVGLVKGTTVTESLSVDPTNEDPYNNLNDGTTFFITTDVPVDSWRFIVEIVDSTAFDIDLYIGLDSNGDGTPQAAEEVCSSTTPSFIEYCNIPTPETGTWWILVQNWAESGNAPDSVTLSYGVVPNTSAGNMAVTGPNTVPELTPFSLSIAWDEPTMTAGEYWYGAFSVGSSPATPGNLGTVDVNLDRIGNPIIAIAPEELTSTQQQESQTQQILTISNSGNADLDWDATSRQPGMELMQDGSFEQGPATPHWSRANTAGFDPICDMNCTSSGNNLARTGDWWLWLGGASQAMTASATQNVVIPEGPAELSFWLWMGVPTGAAGTLEVQIDGITQMTITEADAATYGGYAQAIVDVSAFADGGSHEVKLTMTKPGGLNINFFIDDVSLQTFDDAQACKPIQDISWLNLDPAVGTVAPAGSEETAVIFNSAGLAQGSYSESLCLTSNDITNPLISVPVSLTVAGAADIMVSPESLSSSQATNTTTMQALTISNVGDADLVWELGEEISKQQRIPEDVLWDQPRNGGSGGGAADFFVQANTGAYSAADFVLTAPASIETIFAEGFVNNGTLADAQAISWAIYADAAGKPAGHPEDNSGTAVWQYTSIPTGSGVNIGGNNIGLDLAAAGESLELDSGTYWLIVYPSIDTTNLPRWNWLEADNPAATSPGQIIDPSNFFGAGLINWTPWPSISDITDFAFRIEGSPVTCVADALPWVSADTTSGTIAAGNNTVIQVTFDATGLADGVYNGNFCIESNDPTSPSVTVPITLTVETAP